MRSKAGRVAGVLRYPISATAVEKPLPRKGPESFPSWTSPVRPRSPALVNSRVGRRRSLSEPPSVAVWWLFRPPLGPAPMEDDEDELGTWGRRRGRGRGRRRG